MLADWRICSVLVALVEAGLRPSPAYTLESECEPALSEASEIVVAPADSVAVLVVTPLSSSLTVPCGVGTLPETVIVAEPWP